MKKQLSFLYVLLFLLAAVLLGSIFFLFTMDTEPEELEGYEDYLRYQEDVKIVDAPTAPACTVPDATETTEPPVYLEFDPEYLRQINPDFDSWLMLPDTEISFPVVMPEDNFYYLNRGFDREYSGYGCLFFDVLSVPGSDNRVIYGHNIIGNQPFMFSHLVKFQEQAYADEHPLAYLSASPSCHSEVYQLFAVVNFNLARLADLDFAQSDFETPEEQEAFVAYLKDLSVIETDFVPDGTLLILATCNRSFGDDYLGSGNRLLICYGQQKQG